MIPGTTTKLSESTVASTTIVDIKSDLVLVTGTTAIQKIIPHFGGGFSGIAFLIPLDGSVALQTGQNIAVAQTMIINKITVLIYSKTEDLWYPHALA